MSVHVSITPGVLRWAVQRTGLSLDELTQRTNLHGLPAWLEGEKKPTLRQAEALASAARIPFGYLLLDEPTEDEVSVPDFRTVSSRGVAKASPNLQDVITESSRRLGWYAEYAEEVGISAPDIIGQAELSVPPKEAAHNITEILGWTAGAARAGREAVAYFADAIENAGILVMRSSIVGNNSSRKLDVEEFRGFTLLEEGFGLIFVNSADAKSAQLFSLAHELGHVAIATEGISGDGDSLHRVERWCNVFAAELLLPESEFLKSFSRSQDLLDFVDKQTKKYGVSREAVVWRLVDLEKVQRAEAQKIIDSLPKPPIPRRGNGGDFKYTTRTRLGRRFLDAVAEAAASGELPQRDAARFLGVRKSKAFHNLINFAQEAA